MRPAVPFRKCGSEFSMTESARLKHFIGSGLMPTGGPKLVKLVDMPVAAKRTATVPVIGGSGTKRHTAQQRRPSYLR
jgi:hypothetical protein